MIINEAKLFDILNSTKKAILFEADYTSRYTPIGLAKISTYLKKSGATVVFQKHYAPINEDFIFLTTLFTYEWQAIKDCIRNIRVFNKNTPIVIGGVAATLLPLDMEKEFAEVFGNIYIFSGTSNLLDMQEADYSIDWRREEKYKGFHTLFTTRGCANKCSYCAVRKVEPFGWEIPNWKDLIKSNKTVTMIMDNNLTSFSKKHYLGVFDFLREDKKQVLFNSGFDVKHITDDVIKGLTDVRIYPRGLRVAFDRIEDDGIFQENAAKLLTVTRSNQKMQLRYVMQAYVLYNFTDTIKEAYYRATECSKLGIDPYVQRYTPLISKTRNSKFISKNWTETLIRAFGTYYMSRGIFRRIDFYDWLKKEDGNKFKLTNEDKEKLVL